MLSHHPEQLKHEGSFLRDNLQPNASSEEKEGL